MCMYVHMYVQTCIHRCMCVDMSDQKGICCHCLKCNNQILLPIDFFICNSFREIHGHKTHATKHSHSHTHIYGQTHMHLLLVFFGEFVFLLWLQLQRPRPRRRRRQPTTTTPKTRCLFLSVHRNRKKLIEVINKLWLT